MKTPTFITIDHGFWNRRLCHPSYCILYFELATEDQHELPSLLRRLLRLPGFRTRSDRMGKVARVRGELVSYWEAGKKHAMELPEQN